jgi:hypothetical protein
MRAYMDNISILEIRKLRFIENQNYENYKKLLTKADRNKEIFDNQFFSSATKSAFSQKNLKGLLFISQLYIALNRNVEAEYILLSAYEIDNTNNEILYHLFDILCRRKQLGLTSYFLDKIDALKDEPLFIKSSIKYFLLTNRKKDLSDIIELYFHKLSSDHEFVALVLIAAVQNDNSQLTYLVSKTKYQKELFSGLSGQYEYRIKRHFYKVIINLLREKINGHKSR